MSLKCRSARYVVAVEDQFCCCYSTGIAFDWFLFYCLLDRLYHRYYIVHDQVPLSFTLFFPSCLCITQLPFLQLRRASIDLLSGCDMNFEKHSPRDRAVVTVIGVVTNRRHAATAIYDPIYLIEKRDSEWMQERNFTHTRTNFYNSDIFAWKFVRKENFRERKNF